MTLQSQLSICGRDIGVLLNAREDLKLLCFTEKDTFFYSQDNNQIIINLDN